MQTNQVKKVEKWAANLTKEQMEPLIVQLIHCAYESRQVNIGDVSPYWESTGEPLIEGQATFSE